MFIGNPCKDPAAIQKFPLRPGHGLPHINAGPENHRHPFVDIISQQPFHRLPCFIDNVIGFTNGFFQRFFNNRRIAAEIIFAVRTAAEMLVWICPVNLTVPHLKFSTFQIIFDKRVHRYIITEKLKEHHRRDALAPRRILSFLADIGYINFYHSLCLFAPGHFLHNCQNCDQQHKAQSERYNPGF